MPERHESPRPPSPPLNEPGTDPHIPVYPEYLKRKMTEAKDEGARQAKVTGLAWGISTVAVAVGIAFGVYFKLDDRMQDKADNAQAQAIKEADAGADKKLAPLVTDVAVMKNDISTLKDDVAEIKAAQKQSSERDAEMLRLLRKRDKP